MNKIDWKRKLTSRKWWLALTGFITGLIIAFGGSDETATMPIDDWVYYKRFYVSSVNGNRVVLDKSPDSSVLAINTAFNITDLKKV